MLTVGDNFVGGDVGDHNQPNAGVPPHLYPLGDAGSRTVARRNHFYHQLGNQAGDVATVRRRADDALSGINRVIGGANPPI